MYKLNLTANNPKYAVVLPLSSGGRSLRLELGYNRFGDVWSMSLYDNVEDKYLVSRAPLLLIQNETIVCGILRQMRYLGIGEFVLLMKERGATESNPSYMNLVEDFDLFWGES